MGYEEYIDLIEKAKFNGDYIVYTLDGEHFSRNDDHNLFVIKSIELMKEMTKEFLLLDNVLVNDQNIKINDFNSKNNTFSAYCNPSFTNGDFITFSFYNDKITLSLFKDVFYRCIKRINNNFAYHLAILRYDTTDYKKGKNSLWVGYAQQYLSNTKKERIETLNNKKR